VDYLALKVDEINVFVLREMRRKKRKARRGAVRVTHAQADASAFEGVLFDHRHNSSGSSDGAEDGKASEQGAPLQ
jgi:hypothetical protein